MPIESADPALKITRPQIYFGQETTTDVYVKTKQKEFDFPQGESNTYTSYEGSGGIRIGNGVRRLLLAWALGDLSKRTPPTDLHQRACPVSCFQICRLNRRIPR